MKITVRRSPVVTELSFSELTDGVLYRAIRYNDIPITTDYIGIKSRDKFLILSPVPQLPMATWEDFATFVPCPVNTTITIQQED